MENNTCREVVLYVAPGEPPVKLENDTVLFDEDGWEIPALISEEDAQKFPVQVTLTTILLLVLIQIRKSFGIMHFEPSFEVESPIARRFAVISDGEARDILMIMNRPHVHQVPQRFSDLQRGERYQNMDFEFYSSILVAIDASWTLKQVTYDEACTAKCSCGCHKLNAPPAAMRAKL
ncbi:hypothetical protein C8R43DRAFT_1124245 [Mycena crocata]|nr:hypothetical protein C8R43DRAFT_1124245 [Mycena crocata]